MITASYPVFSLDPILTETPSARRAPFVARVPVLTPTIAPVGADRLIPVRSMRDEAVTVRGGVTGRVYRFEPGVALDVPLADARLLVAEGEFAFSGGR
jgi:hypothetical protein